MYIVGKNQNTEKRCNQMKKIKLFMKNNNKNKATRDITLITAYKRIKQKIIIKKYV